MYKMCYSFLDGKWEDYLIPNRERRTRGSHDFKYTVLKGHKNIFRFSFFPRKITEWNKLVEKLLPVNLSLFQQSSLGYLVTTVCNYQFLFVVLPLIIILFVFQCFRVGMMSLVDAITDKIILRFRFLLFYGTIRI